MSKPPVHEVRIGPIKASIWLNQTKMGPHYNVTVTRLFKDGDMWRQSGHFGKDDLLPLAKCIDLAHTYIVANAQQDSVVVSKQPINSMSMKGH